jgi:hypothetical protein
MNHYYSWSVSHRVFETPNTIRIHPHASTTMAGVILRWCSDYLSSYLSSTHVVLLF